MRPRLRFSLPLFLAVVTALISLAAFSNQSAEDPVARLVATPTTIEWQAVDRGTILLSLQRPDGEVIRQTFAAGRNPMLNLEGYRDGLYSYELRAGDDVQSGSFTIQNGTVVRPDARENARVSRPPANPVTTTFFNDDVSATGGLCGGADCTNAETYGLSPIKMKANNTRIKFEDTSTSVGFPSTDWQLSANDSTSGGANKFFVEDLTAATVPFLIEGGTPTNTLYVDSTGRVGVRTSTPGKTLHLADPVVPTIRMENTTSPLQNWDVSGSNNNFIIRDVNHESDPFIIRTNASYYSLVIDTAGKIGLGVSSPLYQIHHSSGARLDAGVWVDASSRAVKQDIQQLDRDAAFDALRSLQPVTFAYKANPKDSHVGFIAEDVPDLVATPDRTGLAPMDVVAVLTKVIQEQQKTIDQLKTRLDCLEERQ